MARALRPKQRFYIFERDQFTCQYCGRRPPGVVLEVDHVVSVASGGTDEPENLVTSCFECNRGKGASKVSADAPDMAARLAEAELREAQLKAYGRYLKRRRRREEELSHDIYVGFHDLFAEVYKQQLYLTKASCRSLDTFIKRLHEDEVRHAFEKTWAFADKGWCDKPEGVWKYFCGVCWSLIRGEGMR